MKKIFGVDDSSTVRPQGNLARLQAGSQVAEAVGGPDALGDSVAGRRGAVYRLAV